MDGGAFPKEPANESRHQVASHIRDDLEEASTRSCCGLNHVSTRHHYVLNLILGVLHQVSLTGDQTIKDQYFVFSKYLMRFLFQPRRREAPLMEACQTCRISLRLSRRPGMRRQQIGCFSKCPCGHFT